MNKFSPSTLGFYPEALLDRYTLPDDCVDVSDDILAEFQQSPPEGMVRGSDENGQPCWVDAPPPPPPSAKDVRDAALNALAHDFGDGRVMQTRPMDEQNIRGSIELMADLGMETIDWVMVDNVKYPVTSEELQTALNAGRLAALSIWSSYEP